MVSWRVRHVSNDRVILIAFDAESSNESSDDHFSDAHSGLENSTLNSPTEVPIARVEKVDNEPSHGEIRGRDAEPDEMTPFPDHTDIGFDGAAGDRRASTPGGRPIPTTVVEKIDTDVPSYGEVPGTPAHEMRLADAVPDMVVRSASGYSSRSSSISRARAGSTPGDLPIPVTKVEKVDSKPSFGEVPGTEAYEKRKQDAEPDMVEQVRDLPGKPMSSFRTSASD